MKCFTPENNAYCLPNVNALTNLTLGFSFTKQNNDDKRNKSHISFICFRMLSFRVRVA